MSTITIAAFQFMVYFYVSISLIPKLCFMKQIQPHLLYSLHFPVCLPYCQAEKQKYDNISPSIAMLVSNLIIIQSEIFTRKQW